MVLLHEYSNLFWFNLFPGFCTVTSLLHDSVPASHVSPVRPEEGIEAARSGLCEGANRRLKQSQSLEYFFKFLVEIGSLLPIMRLPRSGYPLPRMTVQLIILLCPPCSASQRR